MKSTTTLLALFLLSAFTSYLPSATAFVFDMDGDPLRNGGTYFVLPVMRGWGGGIGLFQTGNETCPLTVVQSPNELSKGFPTMISSLLRIPSIREGDRLIIRFSLVPWCAPTPSEWTIAEGLPESPAVKLTGYQNTVDGWFKIKKVSPNRNGYKLLFCPLPVDDSTCGDIGSARGSLVVSKNNPLVVQFQKIGSALNEVPLAMKNIHGLSGSV